MCPLLLILSVHDKAAACGAGQSMKLEGPKRNYCQEFCVSFVV